MVRFGPGYLERFGERMPDPHSRALFDTDFAGSACTPAKHGYGTDYG